MSADLPRVERDDDGHPVWIHDCPGGAPEMQPSRATLPLGSIGWHWSADGGLTPSILCNNCGIHGFWMGGESPHWRAV